jgi:hypothetical protein
LEDLLEQMASGIQQDVQSQLENVNSSVASSVAVAVAAATATLEAAATARTSTLFRGYDAQMQERFKELEESLADIRELQEKAQTSSGALAVRVAELEKLVAISERVAAGAAIPAILATEQWKRNPDATVIILSTAVLAAKSAVEDAIGAWVSQVAKKEQYRVESASMSKRFVLRFTGEAMAAGRRCRTAFEALRNSNGSWLELQVDGPGGTKTTLYTSADKNKKQAATERCGKILQKALASVAGKEVALQKREGQCTVSWDVVAKVEPQEDGSCNLLMVGEALTKHGINREAVKEKFAELHAGRSSSTLQWTI